MNSVFKFIDMDLNSESPFLKENLKTDFGM